MQLEFNKRNKYKLFIHHENKRCSVFSRETFKVKRNKQVLTGLAVCLLQYVTPMYSTINTEASFLLNPCWESCSVRSLLKNSLCIVSILFLGRKWE
ncbi:hypothetical protein VIGAN_09045900 [Vigna angularis var. angularis]|uniref:Uncharacterized protein n=1 Tax=Vigna angularis var. angularis TaxID=157739 RepID=A0A0S3SWN5_PHAAN|nr:hypothetical protein VIGAN_09045900 [Vigna angularis var. angularis]